MRTKNIRKKPTKARKANQKQRPRFSSESTYTLRVPRGFSAAIRGARGKIGRLAILIVDQLPYRPTGERIAATLESLSALAKDAAYVQSMIERMLIAPRRTPRILRSK